MQLAGYAGLLFMLAIYGLAAIADRGVRRRKERRGS